MRLSCRFYKEKYPEVDEVVMVYVKSVTEMGAYVNLLEYDNVEGFIELSEITRRRIRSVNKVMRVGKTEPAVVIRVDNEKHYIDLSKRGVVPEDVQRCNEQFSNGKVVNSILRHVANLLGYDVDAQLEELYCKTAWYFEEKYKRKASAYDAFKEVVKDPTIFDECPGLDEDTKSVLLQNVRQKLMLQTVKIRADIEVFCFSYEGIEAVKKALRAGMELSTDQMSIKINLIASPLYVVTTSAPNEQEGIALLQQVIKKIDEVITKLEGHYKTVLAPKVVTTLDDEELQGRLEDLQIWNDEETGEDEEEDQVDESGDGAEEPGVN